MPAPVTSRPVIWRGGGVVFGPKPRDYSKKISKSTRRLAFQKALSERINAGDVLTVDKFAVTEIKTKAFRRARQEADGRAQSSAHFRFVRRQHFQVGAKREIGDAGHCDRCKHGAVARFSQDFGYGQGARETGGKDKSSFAWPTADRLQMNEPYDIIQTASLTEKSSLLSEKLNKYVFRVSPRANKIQIKNAIERLFQKKVVDVNTCNYAGKKKRERRADYGRKPHWKKAIVTLERGREDRPRLIYGTQDFSPTHSDAAFQVAACFRRDHEVEAGEKPSRDEKENRWPQQPWPADVASHRWRAQTKISQGRFQTPETRSCRRGRRHRIRSESLGPHRSD